MRQESVAPGVLLDIVEGDCGTVVDQGGGYVCREVVAVDGGPVLDEAWDGGRHSVRRGPPL